MRFLWYLLQFTWALPQNLAGALRFLCCLGKKHGLYHGAILTRVRRRSFRGGWTLGCFIFLTEPLTPEEEHDLLIHEYGHAVQSLILGPFWSLLIGLPSTVWCRLPCFRRLRQRKGLSYSSLYCEGWASALGEKYTDEHMHRPL